MVSFLCPKIIVMSISVKRIEYPDHSMTELPVRKGKTQIRAMRMVIQPWAQPHLSACRRRYNEVMNTIKRVKRNPNQTVR